MGRNDTLVMQNINSMCMMLNINQDEAVKKIRKILEIYRGVVWLTLDNANCIKESFLYYGDELEAALIYLENFASNSEKEDVQARVRKLFENKWMVDIIDGAVKKVRNYQNNGTLYHEILFKCYLSKEVCTDEVLFHRMHMERSTFYQKKREAILLLGISLLGNTIPILKEIIKNPNIMNDIPDIFKMK